MPSSVADLTSAARDGIGVPVDADVARQRADDILSRPEFQDPGESLLDRMLDWLGDRIADVLTEPGQAGARGIVTWVLVAAFVALVVWILVTSWRSPGRARARGTAGVTYGTETVRGPAVWMAEADRLAGAGDFRGALRCRHQALIARWVVDGTIPHVVGQTAFECHSAARESGAVDVDSSTAVLDHFTHVWYGGAEVDAAGYRRFADLCDSLAVHRRPVGARR